jgi:hypothetical protein
MKYEFDAQGRKGCQWGIQSTQVLKALMKSCFAKLEVPTWCASYTDPERMCNQPWNLFSLSNSMSKLGYGFRYHHLIVGALEAVRFRISRWR